MPDALAASIVHALLGFELGASTQDGNRFSLDGLVLRGTQDGAIGFAIRKCEAAALRLASGPFVLEAGRLVLNQFAGKVQAVEGKPRLVGLEAATAELGNVKFHGPVLFPKKMGDPAAWVLEPLAAAEGTIRAKIIDAQLLFDADVTVPVRKGQVQFNDATVEHVGPDSRMGISRMGLYVDAPNGRSYLYQFASAPAGAEFEHRGAMLGPWVTDRGSLRLQEFAEGQLRSGPPAAGQGGFTEQARLLLDRTSMSGELQLGDGKLSAPGVEAQLAGRASGRNAIRVHSEAVGRGLTAELASLSVRDAVLKLPGLPMRCDEVAGSLTLRLFVEGRQLRFAFECRELKVSGLRLA